MVTDKFKELENARAKVAALEQSIATQLKAELAGLPARYGFENVASFVSAVRAAHGKRRGRKPAAAKTQDTKPAGRKRRRAKITDEIRAEVKKMTEAGRTGSEIAAALKISVPSVQNIRKRLGLVGNSKPGRKAKAAKS